MERKQTSNISIYEQENALFKEWESSVSILIKDGVVDESKYIESSYKIVFVLKEVNGDENGEAWDLREFLAAGGRRQTWDNIARWTEGLLRIDEELRWEYMENGNDERRLKYLPHICAMNLKKTPGKDSTVPTELHDAAKRDGEFLRRQLNLYNPDIIILCGTESAFYSQVCNDKEYEWKQTSRGIWYAKDNNTIIVTFVHPNIRNKECVFYYGLIDAVKEILGKKILA